MELKMKKQRIIIGILFVFAFLPSVSFAGFNIGKLKEVVQQVKQIEKTINDLSEPEEEVVAEKSKTEEVVDEEEVEVVAEESKTEEVVVEKTEVQPVVAREIEEAEEAKEAKEAKRLEEDRAKYEARKEAKIIKRKAKEAKWAKQREENEAKEKAREAKWAKQRKEHKEANAELERLLRESFSEENVRKREEERNVRDAKLAKEADEARAVEDAKWAKFKKEKEAEWAKQREEARLAKIAQNKRADEQRQASGVNLEGKYLDANIFFPSYGGGPTEKWITLREFTDTIFSSPKAQGQVKLSSAKHAGSIGFRFKIPGEKSLIFLFSYDDGDLFPAYCGTPDALESVAGIQESAYIGELMKAMVKGIREQY